tara:strand:- start:309 stop:647 length:339 start_codon:yes stop_codon:yes gene_type:complete
MYKIFEELENEVVDWGFRNGILFRTEIYSDADIAMRKEKQIRKFSEEHDELLDEVFYGNVDTVRDEMGDVLVTLAIQANLWGLSLTECLDEAYNKINVRTGHMIDGVFVKDE